MTNIGVLKNLAKFTGKHLCQSLFKKAAGLRPATLLKKYSDTGEFCKFFKSAYFYRKQLPVAASVGCHLIL